MKHILSVLSSLVQHLYSIVTSESFSKLLALLCGPNGRLFLGLLLGTLVALFGVSCLAVFYPDFFGGY